MNVTLETIRGRCTECGDCWEFMRLDGKRAGSQATLRIDGAPRNVRRATYSLAKGYTLPSGRKLVNDCGNRFCINPEHHKAMTVTEKALRAVARGTFKTFSRKVRIAAAKRANHAKLDMDKVRQIREGVASLTGMAKMFGVNRSVIMRIRSGKSWKDYSSPFAGLGGRS